jgi:hypothetical protein
MLPWLEAKSTGENQGRNRLNAVSGGDCEVRAGFDDCLQEPKGFIAGLPGASKRRYPDFNQHPESMRLTFRGSVWRTSQFARDSGRSGSRAGERLE